MNKVCIVGGGASGMTAAIAAARAGADTLLLEHKDQIGKKILVTGNGRCNLTNLEMSSAYYRSENKDFISQALQRFGAKDALLFFKKLGVLTRERNGCVYPLSNQAGTVLSALVMELVRSRVVCRTGAHVIKVAPKKKGFLVCTETESFTADKVILSTGGKAAKVHGSDGSGYQLAKSLGHSLVPVVPALTAVHADSALFKKSAGVRVEGGIRLYVDGVLVSEDRGELQLADYGISGIPTFNISRFAARGLYQRRPVKAVLDFIPSMTKEELCGFFFERQKCWDDNTMEEFLNGIFPKRLIPALLGEAQIKCRAGVSSCPAFKIRRLLEVCKQFETSVTDTNSFEQSQVCAGGVRTEELFEETMESRYVNGLYLTGELLDVDGICGGYNLQWAWTSGYLAGTHAAGTPAH